MKKLLAGILCSAALLAQPVMAIEPPVKGELQSSVKKLFGEPKEKKEPVGEPPISSWVYDEFTVYFESNYVIHSVVHRTTKP